MKLFFLARLSMLLCGSMMISSLSANEGGVHHDFMKEASFDGGFNQKTETTIKQAFELINERDARTLVLTCASTFKANRILGKFASILGASSLPQINQAQLNIVTLNPQNSIDGQLVESYFQAVNIFDEDPIDFLTAFGGTIDFLYIDTASYQENPSSSSRARLKMIKAAESKFDENTVILFGSFSGEAKNDSAVKYLLSRGWQIYLEDHQTIITRIQP